MSKTVRGKSLFVTINGMEKVGFWGSKGPGTHLAHTELVKVDIVVSPSGIDGFWGKANSLADLETPMPAGVRTERVDIADIRSIELQNAMQYTGKPNPGDVNAIPADATAWKMATGRDASRFTYNSGNHWILFVFTNDGERVILCNVYDGYPYLLAVQTKIMNALEAVKRDAARPASDEASDYL